ncbi:D-alanyl-D-alanine carboxypeptidase family protein [Arvimicrobium flavum]|uniref:D-alanyl-D-alanine carboxypeptidase family protein n=1 Tax=Arvimicrobium flavum TaxID=3393320 RepID=UPI00237B3FC8|nr:D-alanyl-D-alanine carboxypeptidase family protein [Mesorhizobium shangrilense]
MLPRRAGIVVAALSILLACGSQLRAQPFETKATEAFVIDVGTGSMLLDQQADRPVPPASMAKMMTMAVVFDAIKTGKLSLDAMFTVSENAWRTGGAPSGTSTMFAALKSSIRVEDLIKGVMVQGANDGCIILAEGIAGSEAEFVKMMNAQARAIGLKKSAFVNSTGLPAEGQQVTMRELVTLARHLSEQYPDLFAYYALPEFTWNKITQRNRNPLLRMGIGADGVLTGYTENSGYSIVGSMNEDGKRVFAALGGLKTEPDRAEEARRVFDWVRKGFTKREMFATGQPVGQVPVYGGARSTISVRASGAVSILTPNEGQGDLAARIVYQGPIVAPVEEGTPIGVLRVTAGGQVTMETPVFAAEAMGLGSLHQRAFDAIAELAVGWLRNL